LSRKVDECKPLVGGEYADEAAATAAAQLVLAFETALARLVRSFSPRHTSAWSVS
jgi:hypothetical protein